MVHKTPLAPNIQGLWRCHAIWNRRKTRTIFARERWSYSLPRLFSSAYLLLSLIIMKLNSYPLPYSSRPSPCIGNYSLKPDFLFCKFYISPPQCHYTPLPLCTPRLDSPLCPHTFIQNTVNEALLSATCGHRQQAEKGWMWQSLVLRKKKKVLKNKRGPNRFPKFKCIHFIPRLHREWDNSRIQTAMPWIGIKPFLNVWVTAKFPMETLCF